MRSMSISRVGSTSIESFEEGMKFTGAGFRKFAEDFSLLRRIGEVEEVANIVAFVASPQASWIVGIQSKY